MEVQCASVQWGNRGCRTLKFSLQVWGFWRNGIDIRSCSTSRSTQTAQQRCHCQNWKKISYQLFFYTYKRFLISRLFSSQTKYFEEKWLPYYRNESIAKHCRITFSQGINLYKSSIQKRMNLWSQSFSFLLLLQNNIQYDSERSISDRLLFYYLLYRNILVWKTTFNIDLWGSYCM